MQKEKWKVVEGYPNYKISNKGNIYSLYNKKLLKPTENDRGYMTIGLSNNGKSKQYKVARLVGIHFLGLTQDKFIDHIDRNKSNNNIKNLRVCTRTENNWNKGKVKKKGYLGVFFEKRRQKYRARITNNGKTYSEYFLLEREAALQYNEWAVSLRGKFAVTNKIDS